MTSRKIIFSKTGSQSTNVSMELGMQDMEMRSQPSSSRLGTEDFSEPRTKQRRICGRKSTTTKEVSHKSGNCIIDLSILAAMLHEVACCKTCHCILNLFTVKAESTCSSKFLMRCDNCQLTVPFQSVGQCKERKPFTNDPLINKITQLDVTSVIAARLSGIGASKMDIVHGVLNIPPPPTPGGVMGVWGNGGGVRGEGA